MEVHCDMRTAYNFFTDPVNQAKSENKHVGQMELVEEIDQDNKVYYSLQPLMFPLACKWRVL